MGQPRDANGMINCEQEVPGHEGPVRLHPRQGPEGRHLLLARPVRPARASPEATSMRPQDARRYAEWGFDYLKYDWCSYGNIAKTETDLPKLKKPYFVMRKALDKVEPRHRLQPLPVRHGRRLEVGRRGRRQLLAHHRRHRRLVGEHGRHRLLAERPRKVRRPRPLERSRHARGRHGRLGPTCTRPT